jgi:arylsulfatase A-like enzyme
VRRERKLSAVSIILILAIAFGQTVSARADEATLEDLLGNLASPEYAIRFDAAMGLVSSTDPELDDLLSQGIHEGSFQGSEAASAAAEFVRRKRSGESWGPARPQADPGVNFLLISVDTLRADHLGCYGYHRATAPTMDALGASGAVFETAISPSSWTLPVHMSMFTSLYPSFHKIEKAGRLGSIRLDASVPTLPEILKAAGYATAGFSANGYLDPVWGFDRGFDFYGRYVTQAPEQTGRVVTWLEWHRFHVDRGLVPSRFFGFVHYMDPHNPRRGKTFLPKDGEPTRRRNQVAYYDGEIRYLDAALKPILEALEEAGWRDATMIILTSDHGEEFQDHGAIGHKNTLYHEQLRVPLIVAYPRGIQAGQRIAAPVSLLDIFPTVLAFADRALPGEIQGRSLAPYLKRKDAPDPSVPFASRQIFAELHPIAFGAGWDFFSKAVRTDDRKLILTRFQDGRASRELYDLVNDPGETRNLYEMHKADAAVRELEASLLTFILEGALYNLEFQARNRIALDPETQERLRAQGYVD